ncbi:MAG: hypothetical protein WBC07_08415 [Methylotenera sp.]
MGYMNKLIDLGLVKLLNRALKAKKLSEPCLDDVINKIEINIKANIKAKSRKLAPPEIMPRLKHCEAEIMRAGLSLDKAWLKRIYAREGIIHLWVENPIVSCTSSLCHHTNKPVNE